MQMSKLTDDDISNLPLMEDSVKDFLVRVIVSVFSLLNLARGTVLQVTYACKAVEMTLKYGLGDSSVGAFACFSYGCLATFFETRVAFRASKLSEKLRRRLAEYSSLLRLLVLNYILAFSIYFLRLVRVVNLPAS